MHSKVWSGHFECFHLSVVTFVDAEAVVRRCSVKKALLRILKISQLNTWDSGTGVLLWILRNFYEHFFIEHLWTTVSVDAIFHLLNCHFWKFNEFIWLEMKSLTQNENIPLESFTLEEVSIIDFLFRFSNIISSYSAVASNL